MAPAHLPRCEEHHDLGRHVIRSVGLTRFRGFRTTTLPLEALTVILGPNSAGKSSFGQALVALQQTTSGKSLPNLERPPKVEKDAWPVDLGSYETLCTDGEKGPVSIALEIPTEGGIGRVLLEFGGPAARGLELSRLRIELPGSGPSSVAVGPMPVVGVTLPVTTADSPIAVNVTQPGGRRVYVDLAKKDIAGFWSDQGISEGLLQMDGDWDPLFVRTSGTAQGYANEVLHRFRQSLLSLRYLMPNRTDPWRVRTRKDGKVADDVGFDGRWTGDLLSNRGEMLCTFPARPPLPLERNAARQAIDIPWLVEEASLADLVNRWMAHLHIATKVDVTRKGEELYLKATPHHGLRLRELPDLGFGVSQVLPVIVQGLTLGPDALFVVEQPESQLHPRPQAQLADFFCALAKSGRQALVETHSEPFFHRLRLRATLDPELASKIAVYFLDEPGDERSSDARRIEIGGEREPRWPKGFLEEGIDEELALRAARAAQATKRSEKEK